MDTIEAFSIIPSKEGLFNSYMSHYLSMEDVEDAVYAAGTSLMFFVTS